MRCALSIYNLPTGHSFLILLKYSNPPEMKINKGTRNGLNGKETISQKG